MGRSEVEQNVPVFVMTGLVNVLDAHETRAIEVPTSTVRFHSNTSSETGCTVVK